MTHEEEKFKKFMDDYIIRMRAEHDLFMAQMMVTLIKGILWFSVAFYCLFIFEKYMGLK